MQVAAALHDYGLQKLSLLSRSLTTGGNLPQLGGISEGESLYSFKNIHMIHFLYEISSNLLPP